MIEPLSNKSTTHIDVTVKTGPVGRPWEDWLMENISSKALAKDRSGYTAARSVQSSCCLARGQPWAGRSAGHSMSQHELSTSLGEHARSELCLGVSQDHNLFPGAWVR